MWQMVCGMEWVVWSPFKIGEQAAEDGAGSGTEFTANVDKEEKAGRADET